MADRNIDSTEIDQPLVSTKAIVNGLDIDLAIRNMYASLGVAVHAQNLGTIVAPGLEQPTNDNTVKQLILKLVEAVESTQADAATLAAALDALINDGVTNTTNTWSSSEVDSQIGNMVDDPLHGDNGDGNPHKADETYNQQIIENLITTKFDAALSEIEDMINNAL